MSDDQQDPTDITRPEENWWPAGYQEPAFQVRRQVYGPVSGGDYTRGTSVDGLVYTALRFPTEVEDQGEIVNKGLLRATPFGHDTIHIQWNWPASIYDDWLEVALVRSAFGRPSTVNDGVTIYRKSHSLFKTADYDMPDYSPPIIEDRGPNGFVPPPLPGLEITNTGLTPGYWYYYGLFFRMNEITWVKSMDTMCLLPRDHHHSEHLFDRVPPYYQWMDNNQREGDGFLRQFLRIFGYELDLTREFVESWQKLYWNDFSPMQLLRHYGANIGWQYESGLGDIRYRAMLSDLGFLLDRRGTKGALEEFVEDTTKYECTTTAGENMLLLPDDSDFYTGTGNWGGLHPDTNKTTVVGGVTILPYDKVIVTNVPYTDTPMPPPPDYGRSVMMVNTALADATTALVIACGDSKTTTTEATPLMTGVPVYPGAGYGFSCQLRSQGVLTFTPGIMWFDKDGQPSDLLSTSTTPAGSLTANTWVDVLVEGIAPEGAVYMIPYIFFENRPAAVGGVVQLIYIAGSMVFGLGASGNVTTTAPDRYLTMGDPGETIGAADPGQPDYKPFLLGSPERPQEGVL